MADLHPTGLAQWLAESRITANQLATEIGCTPTAIGNLAHGRTASVNKQILDAIHQRTSLTYEQIIKPPVDEKPPIATGDGRIDKCLMSIAKYFHTDQMRDKCRKYFSHDFLCSGRAYSEYKKSAVSYDQMCAANILEDKQLLCSVLSVAWYTPGDMAEMDSRILHTYWRAYVISPQNLHAPVYNDTFLILELEQSINEMTMMDTPIIRRWWWDQPRYYNEPLTYNGDSKRPINTYMQDPRLVVKENETLSKKLDTLTT